MAAIDLFVPAGTHFYLTVARVGSVADYEMISQAVGHFSHVGVVEVEGLGIALFGAAIVNHDVAPARLADLGVVDGLPHGTGDKFPARKPAEKRDWLGIFIKIEP